ncbi:acyl-CoA Delta-9 desaturase-like [Macrosteles quadrilineatus]|uniref:acyl-CoA Delta-9 desaturase-like n=1 Tax=Macrosteles quadrilineatus TaxID=74068 RepID=UPI0023E1A004|nr:acyl-CoA Delta-9 desaturase-like [Macrosteles quadrilineatus]
MPPNNDAQVDSLLGPVDTEVERSCPLAALPDEHCKSDNNNTPPKPTTYQPKIIWSNVVFISLFHLVALYTFLFKFLLFRFHILSVLWGFFIGGVSGFGVTGGVHRLWAHRAYKAKWPLKVILLACYSVAGQNTVFDWVRDHRVHHKFSETDADPHNSNRGFFFAHVGWLMQKKHPEVLRRGMQVDMSDILQDPLISFHTRHFTIIKLLLCFVFPILVPVYCWGETWTNSILGMSFLRYMLGLNFTWLVNSAAHIYGYKPYDKRIRPAQNLTVSIVAMGEGWHNYHHVFPWDYKAAELGNYKFNLTTALIDMFAKIGWAYDLKSASPSLVSTMVSKHGDGSYEDHGHIHQH